VDVVTPVRGDIFLVNLDPTVGREIRKTRPCVVLSPDELNAHLAAFIVAPLTTGSQPYPFRIPCKVAGKAGYIVVDQLRTVDRRRLVRRVGRLSRAALDRTLSVLLEMFAP
jgi:mRNA interferase MazF